MARINPIGKNAYGGLNFGSPNLNTRRQYTDNSESYINERLRHVYRQTIADTYVRGKLNSIKHFTYDGTYDVRYRNH